VLSYNKTGIVRP